jgi:pyruvate dehydrogenase E2 component (dihydrolipoamide acetyltransferase)
VAEFLMPILGADMTEGTIIAWRKLPGERIERGEIIAEIETDKANVEVECFTPGTLERVLVEEGRKVPVGTPIALITAEGEETIPGPPAPAPEVPAPAPAAAPPPRPRSAAAAGARLRVSPAARQLAGELGVDLAAVTGTGPEGRITRADVEVAAQARKAAPAVDRADERRIRMRQAIASAMSRSAREIPHFHLSRDIDLKSALDWLRAGNENRSVADRIIYAVPLIKAVALALRETPDLNGIWREGRVERLPEINVGMAISLRGGGLVAPAIMDADRKSLDDLMREFRDLVARARAGTLRSTEMTAGTVTITNLGELGADSVFGIIYPPQVALVGFGRITDRPWAVDRAVEVRPVLTASLSADHRVVDGHLGSTYLAALDRLLQAPEAL